MKTLGAGLALLGTFAFSAVVHADDLFGCDHHILYGAPSEESTLLCRLAYALSHDADHKVPDWVAYRLRAEDMSGTVLRTDDYRADTSLNEGERAELSDYEGSGFDRGHMAPAEALSWSEQAMTERFLLSNMAPQVGDGFNRHSWRSLESRVRKWARARGTVYVVTGPIYDPPQDGQIQKIGNNQVSVPTHFYKVIFDPVRVEAIDFIMPNARTPASDIPRQIVSVDTVEEKTDLDFLPELSDEVENVVEAKVQPGLWPTP